MKNRRFPSADTVGLNSARGVLMFGPRFSVLTMVEAVMTFSFEPPGLLYQQGIGPFEPLKYGQKNEVWKR